MSGLYPLRPARPRVYRRAPGYWTYECHCAPYGWNGGVRAGLGNSASHAEALHRALFHIKHGHIDPLEQLYRLPARERTTP